MRRKQVIRKLENQRRDNTPHKDKYEEKRKSVFIKKNGMSEEQLLNEIRGLNKNEYSLNKPKKIKPDYEGFMFEYKKDILGYFKEISDSINKGGIPEEIFENITRIREKIEENFLYWRLKESERYDIKYSFMCLEGLFMAPTFPSIPHQTFDYSEDIELKSYIDLYLLDIQPCISDYDNTIIADTDFMSVGKSRIYSDEPSNEKRIAEEKSRRIKEHFKKYNR